MRQRFKKTYKWRLRQIRKEYPDFVDFGTTEFIILNNLRMDENVKGIMITGSRGTSWERKMWQSYWDSKEGKI
jgi:hypothetical protein